MIRIDPEDGTQIILAYSDWTPEMMALSAHMHDLPRRPGSTGRSTHPLGIDRLKNENSGRDCLAITLLAASCDDLEWRPDEEEVIAIGLALLAVNRDLNQLYRDRRRGRQASMDRRATRVAPDAKDDDARTDRPPSAA